MEAFDFLKEAQRMCKSYADCKGCPLKSSACGIVRCMENYSDEYMRCVTKVVEQWSKEHSLVTNEMKVREIFGAMAVKAMLSVHPSDIDNWLKKPYEGEKT